MTDLKEIADLLRTKGKVRGNPVGISLFKDRIPEGYEPIQEPPCAIVRLAMDEGRKVYFDAEHHDCLVGMHHAGIIPGKKEIVSGEYLSKTSGFFTYEGAARLKAGTPVLPTGMVKAIGAAPLDQVPEGVEVDWIIVVANPHHANFIGSCRLAIEGIPADGAFATSLCGEIFARPWHNRNIIITFGDVGGRMHNRLKQDQVFVILPIQFADYLPRFYSDLKVDVKASREMTKPAHSDFWKKDKLDETAEAREQTPDADASVQLKMPWSEDAQALLKRVPEGIVEMVAENAEDYARGKGYDEVTVKSMDEQMQEMGTSIKEMMDSI